MDPTTDLPRDGAATLGDVVAVLEGAYPLTWAEDWDRPGLVVGDPAAPVRRVHLAVDPTLAVARDSSDADLLVTHHPLLLRGVSHLPATSGKGAVVAALIRSGTALWCGHTDVDRSSRGTVGAWIRALDLHGVAPLASEPSDGETVDAAHGSRLVGLGAVGTVEPTTVGLLARRVAERVPATVQGVRWTGDRDRPVRRVAVCPGAGDSLLDAAVRSGADAYITSDLRHHPALEHLESAADPSAVPALIDVAHSASEALWLPLARELLLEALPGLDIEISGRSTDPWAGRAG